MPIYEFQCDDCASSFETLVRAGHDDDAECPSCHGAKLSRKLSTFGSGRGSGEAVSTGGAPMAADAAAADAGATE